MTPGPMNLSSQIIRRNQERAIYYLLDDHLWKFGITYGGTALGGLDRPNMIKHLDAVNEKTSDRPKQDQLPRDVNEKTL